MSQETDKAVEAAIEIAKAVADTIQELERVPSGVLYAQLMGHMSLATYEKIIDILKRGKVIEEKHHELIWIGPPKETRR